MTISYNWLSEYLPIKIEPEKLSTILTSVGLEVEKLSVFEEVKGGLKGLIIGEVLDVMPHPNADKLKLTKVDIGQLEPLQIVCGASNVAVGQKVVVATVGTTIFPFSGDSITMKIAKIRNIESYGMICAEDEIGLGPSHEGIVVLPKDTKIGIPASEFFSPFTDKVYEIGLTPNRMEAMSHWGVARDVCAYLSLHEKKEYKPKLPEIIFKKDSSHLPIEVSIENKEACKRYSGLCIDQVKVGPSPKWMLEKIKAIGLRSINNIVDITNFILHETGQPLHAFDYEAIKENKIIIKTLPEGTHFTTLDDKERKLSKEDLMICDGYGPLCMAGVFGGRHSGVTEKTHKIFLESAWFDPVYIRKTSFRHELRTDAAIRFEKNIDISNTVEILKRAAELIQKIAGGKIASEIIDIYPHPIHEKEIVLKNEYVARLSGKQYKNETIKNIFISLGFTILSYDENEISVKIPAHKPDISLPADLVEEILRIDGLDNIEIPSSITISPSIESNFKKGLLREKVSGILLGCGFTEILTNSITNSGYFSDEELSTVVKLINNLSKELDIMRPSMLPTALEVIRFNINRKNSNLRFFEFGKTYHFVEVGTYREQNHLCLYTSGAIHENGWKIKNIETNIYYIKGVSEAILASLGITPVNFMEVSHLELETALSIQFRGLTIASIGKVNNRLRSVFDMKQDLYLADFNWDVIIDNAPDKVQSQEIPKYPAVERDLAIIVSADLPYQQILDKVALLKLNKLRSVQIFDVFQSDKLGSGKKSMAFKITFQDQEKTLTDKEIDAWINKIIITLEKELNAEIRK
ncbi:MAG: phenylalanine--tRNA ligase subunit beta [Flavisolibacter sp.]